MKKIIIGALGFILGLIAVLQCPQLLNWSTTELVFSNIFLLILFYIATQMVRYSLEKEEEVVVGEEKKRSKYFIAKVIGVSVALLMLIGILSEQFQQTNTSNLPTNQIPMYGFADKQDYLTNRDPQYAKVDDAFLASIEQGIQNGEGTREEATEHFLNRAFESRNKGDYKTMIQRANQAWLVDDKNHNIYWAYALWYLETSNPPESITTGIKFLEQAKNMYNPLYDTDKSYPLLLCDLGRAYALKGDKIKSIDIFKSGIVYAEKELDSQEQIAKVKSQCVY